MPWVIWDIIVPMLATFLIGLVCGWLLWRWRRRQPIAVGAANLASESTTTVDESANVVLIDERDNAVQRAEAAELEVENLKSQIDLSVMGIDSEEDNTRSVGFAQDADAANIQPAVLDGLQRELEKEKASKAEVEQSLVDLNSRYKKLSTRLEGELSTEDAASIKNAVELEGELTQAKEKIAQQDSTIAELKEQQLSSSAESQTGQQGATAKQNQSEPQSAEEIKALTSALQKEKEEKAAVEQSLSDLNTRYKEVSSQLEESATGNLAIEDKTPELEGELKGTKYTIASQKSELESLQQKAQKEKQLHQQELAEKEKQLVQERTEKEKALDQLARQKNASDQSAVGSNDLSKKSVTDRDGSAGTNEQATVGSANTGGKSPDDTAGESVNTDNSANSTNTATGVISEPGVVASAGISNAGDAAGDGNTTESKADPSATTTQMPQAENQTETNSTETALEQNVTPLAAVETTTTSESKTTTGEQGTSSTPEVNGWVIPDTPPEKSERDDLKKIKGVGPVLEKMLHSQGIYYYKQLALLDASGEQELDNLIPQFSGRIQRDEWVKQAGELQLKKYGTKAG